MTVDLRWFLASVLLLTGGFGASIRADDAEKPQASSIEKDVAGLEFFETKIRPVLVAQCYQCHSSDAEKADKLKAGLLLDTAAGILEGGDTGPSVVPGKPGESLLILAIRHEDLRMPPKEKLPDSVIADFEAWVNHGAPLPGVDDLKPQQGINWEAARQFWAFQPPTRHPLPNVKRSDWPQQDLDYFILAELEIRDLTPVASADKRTLIRRATFDLTGLPPSPSEVASFLADEAPDAYARLIDRLLASPHYGERWGRYWLDVARYAEDKALALAKASPFAFRYRDWVVQALNLDMPYDRFLRLQLAGDLLAEPVTDYFQRLAGLGFQGLGAEYHKGNFAEQVMADELDDRVDTLTRGLLGLTVACARCHDHKYDPIPTRDYYSLASAYQGAALTELPLATPEEVQAYNSWEQELKRKEAALAEWLQTQGSALGKRELKSVGRYLTVAYQIRVLKTQKISFDEAALAKQATLNPAVLKRIVTFWENGTAAKLADVTPFREAADPTLATAKVDGTTATVPEPVQSAIAEFQSVVLNAMTEEERLEQEYQDALAKAEEKEKANVKKAALDAKLDVILKQLARDKGTPFFFEPIETQTLLDEPALAAQKEKQAAIEAHRQTAPPQPDKIHGVSGGGQPMKIYVRGRVDNKGDDAPPGFLQIFAKAKPDSQQSPKFTRLELADAIATPDNPLTARVFVNRVWQYHFGKGIVGTPSNFGLTGDRPTHPELLDDLTVRFIESGWSIKWLHRTIMLSATYRLSSDRQADNALKDPENHYFWRMSPRRLDFEAWRDAVLSVSGRLDSKLGGPSLDLNSPDNVRRSIYIMISRSVPNPTLATFDFPDANVSSARRSVTTIPQQQLFALNSDFIIAAAKALAVRLQTEFDNDQARLEHALQLTYGRPPTEAEQQIGLDFLKAASEQDSADKLSPWEQFAQALLASNEFSWVN